MSDFCGNYKKYNIQITIIHRDITKKQFFIQLGLRNAWHNESTKGDAPPFPQAPTTLNHRHRKEKSI